MVSSVIYVGYIEFVGSFIVLFTVTGLMTLVCCYLPSRAKYTDDMKIQSTAFVGSYAVMRGVALLLGGYPSEV